MRERKPEQAQVGFNGYSLRDGALVVNCKDESTREWFVRSVAELSPWEGEPLKTSDPKELEGFKKVGAFIPGPIEGVSECLKNFQEQNQGLQIERWKVLGTKQHERGLYLVASVPESVAAVMAERNGRLYHGFHNIQVRLFTGKEAPAQEVTEMETICEEEGGPGGGGPGVSAPGAPGPQPSSAQSAGAVKLIKLQRTGHRGGGGVVGPGRRAAGVSGPAECGPVPGGELEETPPPPGGDPPPSL